MAYRRRQGMGRSSTFKEDIYPSPEEDGGGAFSTSPSLAAQAIIAHRDSSHFKDHSKAGGAGAGASPTYNYTSMGRRSSNEEAAGSFWGVVATKAKAILEDDNYVPYQSEYLSQTRPAESLYSSRVVVDLIEYNSKKTDNPTLRKGLNALASSMNRIGDTIGNALEEGRTIVENKTADFIQETRKIQIRRNGNNNEGHGTAGLPSSNHTSQEDLLKASRDVAMATAAKAKLLLRELKTVKADLAFAKQRCSQLEEENKILREAREKGVNPADDDMIRLQLETLLAEKGRLAHENSIYSRENRFLREIVEYHQLTMQDVVYLDEGIEEVTQVYPVPIPAAAVGSSPCRMLSVSPILSPPPSHNDNVSLSRSSSITKEMLSLAKTADLPYKNTTNDAPSSETNY